MNVESEVFKRSNVDFKKLEDYGFVKEKNIFIFEYKFLNDEIIKLVDESYKLVK